MPRANRKSDFSHDPVVEEIRAIRARIWQKAGRTGEGLMQLLRESAAAEKSGNQRAGKRSRRVSATKRRRAATARPRKP